MNVEVFMRAIAEQLVVRHPETTIRDMSDLIPSQCNDPQYRAGVELIASLSPVQREQLREVMSLIAADVLSYLFSSLDGNQDINPGLTLQGEPGDVWNQDLQVTFLAACDKLGV